MRMRLASSLKTTARRFAARRRWLPRCRSSVKRWCASRWRKPTRPDCASRVPCIGCVCSAPPPEAQPHITDYLDAADGLIREGIEKAVAPLAPSAAAPGAAFGQGWPVSQGRRERPPGLPPPSLESPGPPPPGGRREDRAGVLPAPGQNSARGSLPSRRPTPIAAAGPTGWTSLLGFLERQGSSQMSQILALHKRLGLPVARATASVRGRGQARAHAVAPMPCRSEAKPR
jgi:hypothetical protein